jgi:hydroxymethylglutaryl-CoA lyase
MSEMIVLHEVGPRDGLQIERTVVPTAQKLSWIRALMGSGVDMIQVGSFVHKEKVPQMADTDELFADLAAGGPSGVTLSALVLNEKGLERGLACGVGYFCMGVSASDTHSRRNTGMGTAEATERIVAMARRALDAGKGVQVSVQSAFGCGFEGPVPRQRVIDIVRRFVDSGMPTISLADTAGHAHPAQVEEMFGAVAAVDASVRCACHFHDTYGLGLANCYAALKAGVRIFESAFGGLGGCPFTAVTGGNVATEDLVHLLRRMGRRTDVSLDRLIEVAHDAGRFFGREMAGRIQRTGPVPAAPSAAVGGTPSPEASR